MPEMPAPLPRGLPVQHKWPEGMPVGAKISWHNERFPMSLFTPAACNSNHYQTPERLAERGGLSWCEAAAVIQRRPWSKMDDAEAEAVVREAARAL